MSTSPEVPAGPDPAAGFVSELRTPRAAGVAGVVFAVILAVVVVLLHDAFPLDGDPAHWITDAQRRQQITWALELVPYAGIAFLWFIGVIRAQLGDREDRLFATAFLGSGLLFVAMLFSAAATIGAVLALYTSASSIRTDEVRLGSVIGALLLTTFGIRMAAVFTLVTTNLGRRARVVPRWLVVVGYLTGLVLLFAPPRTLAAVLLFPLWVLLLSMEILVASFRRDRADD